jgi:cytochrome c556
MPDPIARSQSAIKLSAQWAVGLLLMPLLTLGSVQTASADDEDVISYRQLIMKELDAESAALGMIVSGQIPPDSLSLQAKAIANSAKSALKAFEPKALGGEAKPDVWVKWDDFSQRMQTFAKKTEEMAKVSESGNVASVTELMIDALPCKGCHDVYRTKKK